jgi:hypothetical protein
MNIATPLDAPGANSDLVHSGCCYLTHSLLFSLWTSVR